LGQRVGKSGPSVHGERVGAAVPLGQDAGAVRTGAAGVLDVWS
jgi:hypothetical protein